ncbi:hypothetical protein AMJ40_06715 [candidate division TA06 bacterium DG_26]|uniref:histidine kinase n=1 Tax=candidate division TA06 bacterium DG_26 TaxID=1703771 RepID=A0A0S7WFE9_UNCT6|nr:MAG: hypothetical protein AMJ40_06715 [candidate division TA06 bacterium DG_26]
MGERVLLDKLKEELRKWEEFNESLLQNIPFAVFTADAQGRIVFVNGSVSELFGISKQQLLGKSIFNLANPTQLLPFVYEHEKEKVLDSVRRLVETGKQQEIGVKTYHKSGRIADVKVRLLQLRDTGGSPTGFAFFAEDITDKKKLQHLLIQSEKLGGLGQLSASIVHQLKNSQGIINTSLYFLDDVLPGKTGEVQKHFRIIREELERSKRIVDNLLAYSRRTGVEREKVDLNRLLTATLSIFSKEMATREVHLLTKYEEDLPPVLGNFEELKEAFLNLIINGIQAMPHGGYLRISTRWDRKNGTIEVEVKDSGVGISKTHLNHIFDPFFTTKEVSDGTGLGLALARSIIVDGHKGNISVESERGKGTMFLVELPVGYGEQEEYL